MADPGGGVRGLEASDCTDLGSACDWLNDFDPITGNDAA